MGYAGKLKEKQDAIKLRERGFSYAQIQKQVHVSKGTLSQWCRNVILSTSQLEKLLERKLVGAEKGRIIGAKRQQQARIERTKSLLRSGREKVGRLSKRDRFMVGIGLYAGDGVKGDKSVGFANSNAKIITFMMSWFREFCGVSEEKLRGAIWLHSDLDESKAKKFWSKMTSIPQIQFTKTYRAELKKGRKVRKKLHKYGIFAIRIFNVDLQRKIRGYMARVLGDDIV